MVRAIRTTEYTEMVSNKLGREHRSGKELASELKKWGWGREGQSSQNNKNSIYKGRQMWVKYMLKEMQIKWLCSVGEDKAGGTNEVEMISKHHIIETPYALGFCQPLPAHSNLYLKSPSELQGESGSKNSSRFFYLLKKAGKKKCRAKVER